MIKQDNLVKGKGFKCGIEIHQQLSGKKLFCSCPAINSKKKPDIFFFRKLRAVSGETGKIDSAAKHEMKKDKIFFYEGNSEDCCLVEMDEEPPHDINKEAFSAAVSVSKLLNAKIVDEVQVMRKTVIDGSNVSGFQRTALVGFKGFIETSKGKVEIDSICIEEEACQKIRARDSDKESNKESNKEINKEINKDKPKNSVSYRLDRLGIPLIEIATKPDIKDPEHAKETAEKIGMILRSTGKCKRGIGTIRQDVNISIEGGARTEIKGFQDLKSMPKVIENEIKRQEELISSGKKIKEQVRKAKPDLTTSFLRPMPGSSRMYPETDVFSIRVDEQMLSNISSVELIEEKSKRYEKLGVNPDLAKVLSKSDKAKMFDNLVKKYPGIKPAFIAETLISTVREIKRKHDTGVDKIGEKEFDIVFKALNSKDITKSSVMDILIDISQDRFKSIEDYKTASDDSLETEIKKIVSEKPGLSQGAYMGLVMKKFSGKVDGKKAMDILKKVVR